MKTILTCVLVCILCVSPGFAEDKTPDQYWGEIRKAAASKFGGLDLNPVLETSYQFSGDYKGPGIGLSVDLPLWSKKRRVENQEQAIKFLSAGSELVRKLETAENTLALLTEQSKMLRAIMAEEGVEGVKALFQAEKEIIEERALVTQYRRELESMISPLSGRVRIRSGVQPVAEEKDSL